MRIKRPTNTTNSREDKSAGRVLNICVDDPNKTFIQIRKKKVGAIRYSKTIRKRQSKGKRSKKKEKNKISATNITDPGKPKKTNVFTKATKKSFGHKKLIPLISVINRVLNRRPIASTNKNELVDNNAWAINIQKLASIKADCPLTTQMVNQCISTTVE